jgi:RNase adaptor protein for sRNA GlmZ degradation
VYIITYATDLIRNESTIANLLCTQVPRRSPPIPHLYTIDARHIRPPPPELCREYSGISKRIQDVVMEDGDARRAAHRAVERLLRFGEEERRSTRYGSGGGSVEVSMSVCCHAGTHRSVAIAERIAQVVKSEVRRMGCGEGVVVICRHVHRVKGCKDPF